MKQRNRLKKRRPAFGQAVRINISLPPALLQRAPELLVKYGFNGLSDYYQARMRKDLGLDLVA